MNLLWTVASVILGFQITAFIFRLQRETTLPWEDRHFPACEYLNLVSIALSVAGVFVMPLVWGVQASTVKGMFAAAMSLFAFYPLAVAAHYRILFRSKAAGNSDTFCSALEGILSVTALLIAGTLVYLASRVVHP
jgi:hypothetical protein